MTDKQEPEDLGNPVSYLVLPEGVPVYDHSGNWIGEVEHVLADEQEDVFHGIIIKTKKGHLFASGAVVEGLYQGGAILSVPGSELPEPSEDSAAKVVGDDNLKSSLKRAWEWLVTPR